MEFKKDSNWIYGTDESGNIIAEVTFPNTEDGAVVINHTFVDPSLRGQGVAAQLIEAAYDTIKAGGKKAYATCPYAIKWFDEHPEKRDILIER
ncbi:MAG: N-acetyltransferase [Clostridiales Family XIII bacterium]|jgi:predicted GNAT family acetyltransferase|nr:N-acetyltransferase [Clostridiales Family XIII bacterium]